MKLKNILNEIKKNDFKSWFGNSKVVDKNGKPLVVYHGSQNKIGKFHDGMIFLPTIITMRIGMLVVSMSMMYIYLYRSH